MAAPEQTINRGLDTSILRPLSEPPDRARVVIVGGGIVGASVAYHLTKVGVGDVVLLERARLTGGTTWHAAGLVAQVRSTHALTELSRINADLFEALPAETGVETGLRRVGSLSVARTPARMEEYRAGLSMARDAGIEAHELSPKDVLDRWPTAAVDDLVGATIFPTDATVNPGDAALALAKGAVDGGARYTEGVTVTGFEATHGAVAAVLTDHGRIQTDTVVLAAGLWTSELARLAGLSVPLYPAEHVWAITEPLDETSESFPILRDLDGYFYVRHYQGGYMVGAFEPQGRPRMPSDIDTGGFVEFGPDWGHFDPVLSNAKERLPALRTAEFRHFLRAPESFTPDSNFHLGEFPELRGMFVAAGFNSQGIIYGPGAGKALAEWIVEGRPTMDLTEVDVSRAGRWSNQRAWLHERTAESLGRLYALHWPGLQPGAARGVRRTPLWNELRAAGAAFGEAAGWERAAWFEPGSGDEPAWGYDVDRPSWFQPVSDEMHAARERVALFDLSTYSKFLVHGTEALAGLQRLCTSDLDVPIGRIVYTLICNEHGGIEMDPTVTRLDEGRFLVLAPTLYQRRTEMLLRNGLPPGATVTDHTSGLATLHVVGPRSRELLGALTEADLSNDAFGFMTAREIEVGWTKAWALRLSFTGELGWELYVPTEFVADLYRRVTDAGGTLGLRHAGAFAFDWLRIERGFRSWGHDVGAVDDPFEAGLGFAVHATKATDFVGRQALEARREAGRMRSLVSVRLEDPDAMLWHGESVLIDGERVGHVTSGAYGHRIGAPVGLAWVHGDISSVRPASVEIRDRVVPAVLQHAAFFDPRGERLRA